MNNRMGVLLAFVLAAAVLTSMTLFTVDQRERAIVFQLGEVKEVITVPGLHFKWPFIQNVRYFDARILTMDTPDAERYITSEKKNLLVDTFVKWRINDARQYYKSVGDEVQAQTRISQTVNATLREEFGKHTVQEVVSEDRDVIMKVVRERANQDAKQIGVEIIDVRLKRVDLPQEVSDSVYKRMDAERKSVANQLRSEGSAASERIRAEADKEREVIIANAYKEAQRIKGEGDAKAAAAYAQAYGQDAEFYAFYRSLEAYRSSFKDRSDVLVLEPNSEFFKYLKGPGKAGK
ncbi:MAG: protease modulator HflC [Burkholderiales bacterium]|nr:protease modulator HflC [Burkholderiales bacterium]